MILIFQTYNKIICKFFLLNKDYVLNVVNMNILLQCISIFQSMEFCNIIVHWPFIDNQLTNDLIFKKNMVELY